MKRYSVYVKFLNGQDLHFMTDTNMLTLSPIQINGAEMIITDDKLHGVNLIHVEKLEVVEIGRGKIGEIVGMK